MGRQINTLEAIQIAKTSSTASLADISLLGRPVSSRIVVPANTVIAMAKKKGADSSLIHSPYPSGMSIEPARKIRKRPRVCSSTAG
jgi:hypothetical protein